MSHSISLRVMKEYIWPSLSSTFGFLEVTEKKSQVQKYSKNMLVLDVCTSEVWNKALKQAADQPSTYSYVAVKSITGLEKSLIRD